jgi:hypothetical protein
MNGKKMKRLASIGVVCLGILHLAVLGLDASGYVPAWIEGGLWTWEHWKPVASQSELLMLQGFAFWSTVGSFAIPLIILGCLLVSMNKRGIEVPRFVGWSLLAWGIVSSLLMPPSGFPIFVLVAAALCVGSPWHAGSQKRGGLR